VQALIGLSNLTGAFLANLATNLIADIKRCNDAVFFLLVVNLAASNRRRSTGQSPIEEGTEGTCNSLEQFELVDIGADMRAEMRLINLTYARKPRDVSSGYAKLVAVRAAALTRIFCTKQKF